MGGLGRFFLIEIFIYQKGGKLLACITVVVAIEGWQTTSGLTIPSLYD
jgi:hypothetical protein